MERPIAREVVIVPFPFSDLTSSKRRPALVLATLEKGDLILCQITSQNKEDKLAVKLTDKDFEKGALNIISYIRSSKIFTGNESIIIYKIGEIKQEKLNEVKQKIKELLKIN